MNGQEQIGILMILKELVPKLSLSWIMQAFIKKGDLREDTARNA
jgi:hypothetical protein